MIEIKISIICYNMMKIYIIVVILLVSMKKIKYVYLYF